MKKAGLIICYVFAGFLAIISAIFVFIEARNLFSGDWLLYENAADGFIRYFFRLLIAIFVMGLSILTYFVFSKKEKKTLRIYFYFGAIALLVSSIIISYFSSNYLNLVFRGVAAIYSFGILLCFYDEYCLNRNKEKA